MGAKKLYTESFTQTEIPILGAESRAGLRALSFAELKHVGHTPSALVLDASSADSWLGPDFANWRAEHPLLPVLILDTESTLRSQLPKDFGSSLDSESALQATLLELNRFRGKVLGTLSDVSGVLDVPSPSATLPEFDGFYRVSIAECFHGQNLAFDVYVKLAQDHFVKILQEGEAFSETQIQKYLEKGVRFLFVKQSDRDRLLRDLLASVDQILSSRAPARAVRTIKTYGAETLSALQACGVSEARIQHAFSFVDRAEKVLHKTGLTESEQIRSALADLDQYDHAVSTTLILSLVSEYFEVDRELFGAILGPAALLHDIGLYGLPVNCQSESEAIMTASERRLYRMHPERGVQILRDSGVSLPGLMLEVIRQHHQRRNLSGFPMKKAGEETHKFAELLGAADELVRLIHQSYVQQGFRPFDHFEQHTLKGFSRHVEMAFRPLLLQAKTSGQ